MRYNFSDEITFDRDTSRPKDKLKHRRRLISGINDQKKNSKEIIKIIKDGMAFYMI